MKKLLSLLGITIIGVSSIFANVEMEFNLYGTPTSTINLKDSVDANGNLEAKLNNPFGFETQFEFMFAEPSKFIDIGMGLSWGMDFFNKIEMLNNSESLGSNYFDFGFNTYLTLGPAARFHIGDMHSFLVNPGLIFNFGYAKDYKSKFMEFYTGFNLDLGYRIWVANKTGFHFGFDIGTDLSFPFKGFANGTINKSTDYYNYDIASGTNAKIYFGVCFNFGDKAPDIAHNKTE